MKIRPSQKVNELVEGKHFTSECQPNGLEKQWISSTSSSSLKKFLPSFVNDDKKKFSLLPRRLFSCKNVHIVDAAADDNDDGNRSAIQGQNQEELEGFVLLLFLMPQHLIHQILSTAWKNFKNLFIHLFFIFFHQRYNKHNAHYSHEWQNIFVIKKFFQYWF